MRMATGMTTECSGELEHVACQRDVHSSRCLWIVEDFLAYGFGGYIEKSGCGNASATGTQVGSLTCFGEYDYWLPRWWALFFQARKKVETQSGVVPKRAKYEEKACGLFSHATQVKMEASKAKGRASTVASLEGNSPSQSRQS